MRILRRRILQNRANILLVFLTYCTIILAITLGAGLAGRTGDNTVLGLPALWAVVLYAAPVFLWLGARVIGRLLDRMPE